MSVFRYRSSLFTTFAESSIYFGYLELARFVESKEKQGMNKILSLFLVPFSMLLGNWPQYHGPMFNKSANLLISTNSSSLLEASPSWTAPTPLGFSSFSTDEKSAFTLIAEEDEDGLLRELCVSLDLFTGERLWQTWLGMANYGHSGGNAGTPNNSGGDGPRSTPSVSEGLVFVYDSSMTLHCLSARSGETIWRIDIIREHNGKNITWKNASSPLLVHDLVIVIGGGPGESIIGIERNTGKVRWKNGSEIATHATPAYATIHGQDQAIFLCRSGLVSINPLNGRELWKQDFPYKVSSASSPVVAGEYIFCSAGYGVGAGLFKISKKSQTFSSKQIWRKRNEMMVHWSTPLYYKGHLYGIFGFKEYGKAPLQCVDLLTGKIRWSQKGFGPGNLIRSGNSLLVLSDEGELIISEANSEKYIEHKRRKILSGKCWSTPILIDHLILARSTKESIALPIR